ncbi:hypothetical protein TNCV_2376051 [Trichonephila clavipes]|nr:hypothetical protein TNCV_2376051 [Trichonephila clavipes]
MENKNYFGNWREKRGGPDNAIGVERPTRNSHSIHHLRTRSSTSDIDFRLQRPPRSGVFRLARVVMQVSAAKTKGAKNKPGSGGIRTHASEETGALNQRLRPLGHFTVASEEARYRCIGERNCRSITNALFLLVLILQAFSSHFHFLM